ncbi:MAG: PrsW family intramembrane metalloprotease [Chloroflexi bacterium]|nr:PrsW family intramembrane metalloprotease [Chloroflexota bacterium]
MQDMALETKRFLAGSPLRRPANAVLFGLFFLFMLAVGAYNLIWPLYGGSVRMIQAFTFGTLIAVIASVPAVFVVWFLDRRQHESPLLLIGAALWGAVVSASMSLVFSNSLYGFILRVAKQSGGTVFGLSAETFASVFTSPLVEEVVKGIAIFVLFWLLRSDFADLRDGVLFGAMVGLGFNAGQYTIFLLDEFAYSGTPPFLSLAALQFVFLGVNGHFIYSALMGAGFGLARQTHRPRMRWLGPLIGIALAIFANMLANSVGTKVINEVVRALTGQRLLFASTPTVIVWYATALGTIASQFWAYILLGIGIYRNEKWEIETIRQELLDEVNTYVTPEEYVLIEEEVPFKGRTVPDYPPKVGHAIMHAQNELAYRKWHVDVEGENVEEDELVKAWRVRISQLRMQAEE